MDKFYLTTPIYYVNAKPHIGHAYSTLSADIIARFYKQKLEHNLSKPPTPSNVRGGTVFFLTGTDEHGAHIAEAAKKQGLQPKAFCDEMSPLFKHAWKNLNIDYTHFIRTTDDYHEQGAKEFIAQLKQNGAVYEGDYTGLYCNNCENFITEKELDKDGNCPHHKKPPQKISEKNWFFKLQQYLPDVLKAIVSERLQIQPEKHRQEVLGLFKQKLTDFSISRPSVKWGIPLPWDTTQTIYVWVEALLNYWTALHSNYKLQATNYKLQNFWPPDLHIIGKDIIKFHCIYWPALLLAYYGGDQKKLPRKIVVHGFFTINGQKMSKTLGNVIDPNDVVEKYGTDGARYLIISQFPFGADGDIEESKFTEKYNADLANGIGNLVSRLAALCMQKNDANSWEIFWRETLRKKGIIHNEYQGVFLVYMEKRQLFETLQYLFGNPILEKFTMGKKDITNEDEYYPVPSVPSINRYITGKEIWNVTDQGKIISYLSTATAALLVMADAVKPFLPQTSEAIISLFDIQNKKITPAKPLFPRK